MEKILARVIFNVEHLTGECNCVFHYFFQNKVFPLNFFSVINNKIVKLLLQVKIIKRIKIKTGGYFLHFIRRRLNKLKMSSTKKQLYYNKFCYIFPLNQKKGE